MNKDDLYQPNALIYTILYCCIALLLHYPVLADSFALTDGRETLIANVAQTSPMLALQLAGYILAVLGLNLLPLLLLLKSMRVLSSALHRNGLSTLPIFLIAVICQWIAVFAFNKLYFPRSSFIFILPVNDTTMLFWLGVGSFSVFVMLGILPALWAFALRLIGLMNKPAVRGALGIFLFAGLIQPLYSHLSTTVTPLQQPNIILIGVDSLSPLHMQHHPGALPVLENLLAESTVFTNTITPLARTFPAWMSILTASYPVHSGARFNLTSFNQLEPRATLSSILKSRGYTTIYAQDERKFNNLDESFDFDHTVGPKPGAAEFVLTKVSDHPLANLALMTSWGKKLFPFIALNRADHIHYDPDEFVTAIVDNLPDDTDKPLFLAAHFCLAHYPYTWRTQGRHIQNSGYSQAIDRMHISALQTLEQQVEGLLQALRARSRLDNAILVILSDHGESLGYTDGYWPSLTGHDNTRDVYKVDGYVAFPGSSTFSGHGSDTLDRTQYQSLLAFQGFGTFKGKFPAVKSNRLASMVDISPTILSALGLDTPEGIDGLDLLATGQKNAARTVVAETGIRFSSLSSIVHLDEDSLLRESQAYYAVEPATARLIVKPEKYADLIATKDITIHTQDWMLALLRKNRSPVFPRVAVLVHKPTGAWTTGKDIAMIRRAPMTILTHGLRQNYGPEIADFDDSWVFHPASGS